MASDGGWGSRRFPPREQVASVKIMTTGEMEELDAEVRLLRELATLVVTSHGVDCEPFQPSDDEHLHGCPMNVLPPNVRSALMGWWERKTQA